MKHGISRAQCFFAGRFTSAKPLFALMVWLVLTGAPQISAALSHGPGGMSHVLHIRCGYHSPGNPAWRAEQDHAVVVKGYGYSVDGNSYRGNDGPTASQNRLIKELWR